MRPQLRRRSADGTAAMTVGYKVTGIDPGDTEFRLGNGLTVRKSPDLVNSPGMYATIRSSSMGWMKTGDAVHMLRFLDELFASDVVLDDEHPEPGEPDDPMEAAVLVAALLIAFPEARFGLGLAGNDTSLSTNDDYLSIGTDTIDLSETGSSRDLLAILFGYLRGNSYWVDDDLVHMLALLSAVCRDTGRVAPVKVLSLTTSGNHQVDPRLFQAYQLVEALLEVGRNESLRRAVQRWNDTYSFTLNPHEIGFIKYVRDASLHFRAEHAGPRLRDTRIALGYDADAGLEREFRRHGIQRLLREAAQAYLLARL